jgi:hypothetical protein
MRLIRLWSAMVVALAVAAGAAAWAPTPASADPECHDEVRETPTGDTYTVPVCTGDGGTGGSGSGSGRHYDPDDLVTVISEVDGQACTIIASRTSDQGEESVAFDELLGDVPLIGVPLQQLWRFIVDGLPGCPSAPVDPDDVAYSFIRESGAPDPSPHIAPGHAITGKASYLETPGSIARTETRATVLGPLTMTFEPTTFTVDWGDGTTMDAGPFTAPGRAYPEGTAHHTYTDVGAYDVVVRQRWNVVWSLAGTGGTVAITGPPARIPAFEVRQVQAVRDR